MRRRPPSLVALLAAILLGGGLAAARPHVVGYERFRGEQSEVEGGAILYSELGCANCHGSSAVKIPRQGPQLADLSKRVDRDWVTTVLATPGHGRKGSTMPAMFSHLPAADRSEAIGQVVAWLGTINTKLKLKPGRHANAERGSALYHEIGCVACHAPTPDFKSPHATAGTSGRWMHAIAHPDFDRKTSLTALTHFLTAPSVYRPDGRMPHIPMEDQDALDLAAHLLDYQSSDPREAKQVAAWPKADKATVTAGREWVETLNCAACHDLPGLKAAPLHPLKDAPAGEGSHCLSAEPARGLPRYDLEADQVTALRAYLSSKARAGDPDGSRTLAAMNCYACHSRDGRGGPVPETNPFFLGDEGLGDSGRLPPPLTGIGHKLQPNWLESVFTGEGRVRPYLKTQMPIYPEPAKALAKQLAAIDVQANALLPTSNPDDLEAGRKLLGTQGGVNCITCHRWDQQASLGIPSLDIASLEKRLRPEWFRSYLLDPASYRPGTLMPPLWPGGHSAVPDVLGGDTERQIGAIWEFIVNGEGLPTGFPDRAGGQFELIPKDRPIIQRTFLEGTGTRAILVGFPAGIHLAYDGARARPTLVWRGRFFDAYNTWFSRFAPFEKPLAETVHAFGEADAKGVEIRFLGYELDEAGNPTFLSRQGDQDLKEHFIAADDRLVRTLTWTGTQRPEITHPEGVEHSSIEEPGRLAITYTWK